MSNKTLLRLCYESSIGLPVCDRTWSRVKLRLLISEPIELNEDRAEAAKKLKAYAHLRKSYPNKRINLVLVNRFVALTSALSRTTLNYCEGKELYRLLQTINPRPSDATIYRWGHQIGIPFSKYKVYQGQELNKWIEKIALNPRFTFHFSHLGAITNGQNQRIA